MQQCWLTIEKMLSGKGRTSCVGITQGRVQENIPQAAAADVHRLVCNVCEDDPVGIQPSIGSFPPNHGLAIWREAQQPQHAVRHSFEDVAPATQTVLDCYTQLVNTDRWDHHNLQVYMAQRPAASAHRHEQLRWQWGRPQTHIPPLASIHAENAVTSEHVFALPLVPMPRKTAKSCPRISRVPRHLYALEDNNFAAKYLELRKNRIAL